MKHLKGVSILQMSYSEDRRIYARKILRKNKRKQFAAFFILFLIGFSIGSLMLSGIIHIVCCRCVTVEATTTPVSENMVVKTIEELETINLGEYKLTAYCACVKCCGKNPNDVGYGITKSGIRAVEGVTVAADPKVIPLGTEIIIDGLGEYTVQDTGGAIKGNRIDVYFDSHQDALEFGVQHKQIYIMKECETNGEV